MNVFSLCYKIFKCSKCKKEMIVVSIIPRYVAQFLYSDRNNKSPPIVDSAFSENTFNRSA